MKVDDFIEYVVENGMMEFPALVERFSEEGLCKRLRQNIKDVYEVEDFQETNLDGRYSTYSGEIEIRCNKKIDEDLMENNKEIKSTAIHESIHALFRRSYGSTGLEYVTRDLSKLKIKKANIKNELKVLFTSKNLIPKLRAMARVFSGYEIYGPMKAKNEAINEGLTDWITARCMDGYAVGGYISETLIYSQLNCFKSDNEIVSLGDAIPIDISNVFNMNEKEYNRFSKEMDARLFYAKMIGELTKDNETKRLNPEGIQYYKEQQKKHAIAIQTTMLKKVILPEMKKEYDSEKCNYKNLTEIREWVDLYIKKTEITSEEIPLKREFDSFWKKCVEKNNQEFLKKVNELKDDNGKINLFKFNKLTERYAWFLGGTEKIMKTVTGKEINEENVVEALKEYYRFYRQEIGRMNGENAEFKEQIEYKYIDRNMFSFEIQEEKEIEETQLPKKTFFRRFIDRVIKAKRITLEQINEAQLSNDSQLPNQQSKSEKGEESLEK